MKNALFCRRLLPVFFLFDTMRRQTYSTTAPQFTTWDAGRPTSAVFVPSGIDSSRVVSFPRRKTSRYLIFVQLRKFP